MNHLQIRHARDEEIPAVAALIWMADEGALKSLLDDKIENLEKIMRFSSVKRNLFSPQNVLVADWRGKIVGALFGYTRRLSARRGIGTMIGMIKVLGPFKFCARLPKMISIARKTSIGSEDFYVRDIAILPDLRGFGIGASLLKATEQICGQPRMALDVATDNKKARRFYKNLGYSVYNLWSLDGKSYFRMVKNL